MPIKEEDHESIKDIDIKKNTMININLKKIDYEEGPETPEEPTESETPEEPAEPENTEVIPGSDDEIEVTTDISAFKIVLANGTTITEWVKRKRKCK